MHAYTIDLHGITSREAFHAELAKVFSFPEYYGRNGDAFDECIDDLVLPASVKVLGFDGFSFRLPGEAKHLAGCLRAMAERCLPGYFKVDGLPWRCSHRAAKESGHLERSISLNSLPNADIRGIQ